VQLAAQVELVALGVAAEVVVVVEDQDPRAGPRGAVEMRRRQAADAAADDHQVVAPRRCPPVGAGASTRSRRRAGAWAFSNEPGWLPRMPFRIGG
jgi:hypothetical protein